jgi:hypothetical protein
MTTTTKTAAAAATTKKRLTFKQERRMLAAAAARGERPATFDEMTVMYPLSWKPCEGAIYLPGKSPEAQRTNAWFIIPKDWAPFLPVMTAA